MVFLRILATLVFGFYVYTGYAQDYDKIIRVFDESYKLEEQQKYEEAINKLKSIYDEKSYEINLRMGWLYYVAGKYEESIEYYSTTIKIMPYSIEPHWGIIFPLNALKKDDEMVSHYQKILEINPNNSIALFRLGLIYYNKKDFILAEKYFDKVVNLYPFDYDALVMDAWTKLQLKNTREAKILFNKALVRKPSDKSAKEGLNLLK